ncbi:hypothetical protein ANN_09285 [Periplaneta americana]|uniref:DUF4817 domain-containing protein n=1 Tax=Periplaneta americana TaxID=6978 RepID=A0ABQ8TKZ1_PERAM|nr:hypothetical protein ANN_09285 [Periplaneta americana]
MAAIEDRKAFCALDFHVNQSVINVQRHCRTKFGADPPSGPTIRKWYTDFKARFFASCCDFIRNDYSCLSDIRLFENHGRQSHVLHQHSHADATKTTLDRSRILDLESVAVEPFLGHRDHPTLLQWITVCGGWLKSEVYKRKVETREELLARILHALL